MNKLSIGQKVSSLPVADWVQGAPVDLKKLLGRVAMIEVFQVNCPGCFLYGLPQAIALHEKYHAGGLTVIGIATAFEDFDKNTRDNLQRLVQTGEVVGETRKTLTEYGQLDDGKLRYRIPFPLAMDRLVERPAHHDANEIDDFILTRIPDFQSQPIPVQEQIKRHVERYFEKLRYRAETFESFNLQGTPSVILLDKNGRLNDCIFGHAPFLEARIQTLLESR